MTNKYEGLEIQEDINLASKTWTLQRIGWVVMLLIVISAVLGFTGGGGVAGINNMKVGGEAEGMQLEYERFLRWEAPAEFKVTLFDVQAPEQQLRFSKDFYEKLQVEQVVPEPKEVQVGKDYITYTFNSEGDEARMIFYLKPQQPGQLQVAVDNGRKKITLSQFVYP
ncbi:hypothetical protein [Pontibacter ruber]|uniref:Uncharacterized protein n=1 Tax=Pontibacter ruber TaxID=1343895 RepID=A0ABW5CS23_9BACT|nr:hypothetical protein [Pontibacter ruber]